MLTERSKSLQCLSSLQFILWELHLYLDTHPDDCEAMARHKKYTEECTAMRADFEEKYGPLSAATGSGCAWLANPWPWDTEECVK